MAVKVEEDPSNLSPLAAAAMPDTEEETEDRCWGVEYTLDDGDDVAGCERHSVVDALRKIV